MRTIVGKLDGHAAVKRFCALPIFAVFVFLAAIVPPSAFAAYGNGVLDKFEQCDDGNLNDGDGCSRIGQVEGDNFPVVLYQVADPPPTPALAELPLRSSITQYGITWTFSAAQRVGRFVNGDYYVVGPVTVTGISPTPTSTNGRHGSMLNISPTAGKSGFDSRVSDGAGFYQASLRVYPGLTVQPGNKLISSRSRPDGLPTIPSVMRPGDNPVSPVASVSILTSVSVPQPLDAFRPSYAAGINTVFLSRNLNRAMLPKLSPVTGTPTLAEFEGYLKRPWVDAVFFNFDAAVEYMAAYGRENGYVMSFAGLLLCLNFTDQQKEPLLVYLTQYGIDLYGLVQGGHSGWNAHGGHGSGRKFPIRFAGMVLNDNGMKSVQAAFGEDQQTQYVNQTPPAGTYQATWHRQPKSVIYAGHQGFAGASKPGWGPYEHLQPSVWVATFGADLYLGETYRRCCTSVSWVGEALAVRLIPGMSAAWAHQAFFDYADRWMSLEDPADLQTMRNASGQLDFDGDFLQGQTKGILSGGGYD